MAKQELINWLQDKIDRLIDKSERISQDYTITRVENVEDLTYRATMNIEKQMLIVKANAFSEVILKIKHGDALVLGLDKISPFGE